MGGNGIALRSSGPTTYRDINKHEAGDMAQRMLGTSDLDETERESIRILNGYEGTAASFDINEALRNGSTLDSSRQAIVDRVDAGMKPLSDNINVIRNVGTTYMRETLGLDLTTILRNPNAVSEASKRLRGTVVQEKNFMSTSYGSSSTFMSRPVLLRIQATKGTKAVFGSHSNMETELVLGRGTKYVIRNISMNNGKIEINVTTIPD